MSESMNIKFVLVIDEPADETIYVIVVNDVEFARLTYHDVQFRNADLLNLNMSQQMKILQTAWNEFERRNSWSDFEFEMEQLA